MIALTNKNGATSVNVTPFRILTLPEATMQNHNITFFHGAAQ